MGRDGGILHGRRQQRQRGQPGFCGKGQGVLRTVGGGQGLNSWERVGGLLTLAMSPEKAGTYNCRDEPLWLTIRNPNGGETCFAAVDLIIFGVRHKRLCLCLKG